MHSHDPNGILRALAQRTRQANIQRLQARRGGVGHALDVQRVALRRVGHVQERVVGAERGRKGAVDVAAAAAVVAGTAVGDAVRAEQVRAVLLVLLVAVLRLRRRLPWLLCSCSLLLAVAGLRQRAGRRGLVLVVLLRRRRGPVQPLLLDLLVVLLRGSRQCLGCGVGERCGLSAPPADVVNVDHTFFPPCPFILSALPLFLSLSSHCRIRLRFRAHTSSLPVARRKGLSLSRIVRLKGKKEELTWTFDRSNNFFYFASPPSSARSHSGGDTSCL